MFHEPLGSCDVQWGNIALNRARRVTMSISIIKALICPTIKINTYYFSKTC